MTALIDKLNQVEFLITEEELLNAIDVSYQSYLSRLTEVERALFHSDLDFYYRKKGKYFVHNTFAGGIIFLREPETINKIEIEFRSDLNEAKASVEYSSAKRNARNIKYKPTAGQVESVTWNMLGVFPNFNKHQEFIKVVLMTIIGKFTKHICEEKRKNSWFMRFEKPFDILLFLDSKLELIYSVEIEQ